MGTLNIATASVKFTSGRVNIGNAVVFGLQKDLKLTGNKYNVALTIFFVPYVLFEIPSNVILKRLRPRVWRMYASWYPLYSKAERQVDPVSACMFLFGLVMMLQGFGLFLLQIRSLHTADAKPSAKL